MTMSLLTKSEATSLPMKLLSITEAAQNSPEQVLAELDSSALGLSSSEAQERLASVGPNALRTHKASPWKVLGRQLGSPILILLIVTAGLSLFLALAMNSGPNARPRHCIHASLTRSLSCGTVLRAKLT